MSEPDKNNDFNKVDYSGVFKDNARQSAPAQPYEETHYEQARKRGFVKGGAVRSMPEESLSLDATTKPSFKRDVLGILVFTLLWCLFVGAFCGVILFMVNRGLYAQEHFKTADGVVLSSEVKSHSGDETTTYSPEIEYRYIVDGVTYTNDDYELNNSSSSGGWADRIVNEHPVGKEITVYYNPDDPQDSALSVGVPAFARIAMLFLQPFVVAGIGMLLLTVKSFANYLRDMRGVAISDVGGAYMRIPMWCGRPKLTASGFELISRPRYSIVYPLVIGYGVTIFASVFYFAIARDFNQPWSESFTAMKIALGVGVFASAVALYKNLTARGSVFSVDTVNGCLALSSKKTNWELPVRDIKQWYLRRFNTSTQVNGQPVVGYLLAIEDKSGTEYPVHLFHKLGANPGRVRAIATQALKLFAEKTKTPFSENIIARPGGPVSLGDILPRSGILRSVVMNTLRYAAKKGDEPLDEDVFTETPPDEKYGSWRVGDYKDLK